MNLITLTTHFLGSRDTAAVFRGMATLAVGSGLARVIAFISIPILTRIYTPEDFGALAVFVALVAILAPMLTLRYVLALPLPRHDGLAMNLMVLSAGLMLVIGAILAIALAFFAEPLLVMISMEVLAPWWWLIVLGLFGVGTYEMLSLWATRRRAYKVISRTQIVQSISGAVVKIGFGAFGAGPIGLLVGHVVAQSGGIAIFIRQFLAEWKTNWRHVRRSRMKRVANRHQGFPIYRLPSQLLMGISASIPVVFISGLYGPHAAGQFGLAISVIAVPVMLFSLTTSNSFYAEAANIGDRNPQQIRHLTVSVAKRLSYLASMPAVVLFFFGPQLFAVVFGEKWELAGIFASILAIYLVFDFLQATLTHLFNIFNQQRLFLLLNIQRVILVLFSFLFAWYHDSSVITAIWIYTILFSLNYMVVMVFALRIITYRSSTIVS